MELLQLLLNALHEEDVRGYQLMRKIEKDKEDEGKLESGETGPKGENKEKGPKGATKKNKKEKKEKKGDFLSIIHGMAHSSPIKPTSVLFRPLAAHPAKCLLPSG